VNPPLPGKGVGCGAGADASRPSLPVKSSLQWPPTGWLWLLQLPRVMLAGAPGRSDSTDKVWLVGACEVRFHFLPCGEWNAERAITLAPTRSREGEEGQGK
jgi:hypothetical protein